MHLSYLDKFLYNALALISFLLILYFVMYEKLRRYNAEIDLPAQIKKEIADLSWDIDPSSITKLLKPTIGIRLKAQDHITGSSKFGGAPDLPASIKWPLYKGTPMGFIAQINLTEVKAFDRDDLLPPKGFLYFFIFIDKENYPSAMEEYRVIYFDGNVSSLKKRAYPEALKEYARFGESSLEFIEYYSLPSYQNYQINELNLSQNDIKQLFKTDDIIDNLGSPTEYTHHRLLGEAVAIQGDVNWEWAFVDLGYLSYDMNEEQKRVLHSREKDFILLFELDFFDEKLQFSQYGGSAVGYFGITRDDLKNGRFEKSILVYQDT